MNSFQSSRIMKLNKGKTGNWSLCSALFH
jgi:hypothetical protein